ncbi:MAG: bifunctional precorrin-2 dehydrogenase/sirohydrochlorin ferrochelatase [Chloroflexota bacterium]|nr:bifunctional precorrin-2 dehydrogenase/sirohydrochlorin ferrochelatase [Chloroflexota bacterium]
MRTETAVYPIYLTGLANRLAIVVGGGLVGTRKAGGLLAAGGRVRLISPQATPTIQDWAAGGALEWLARPYQPGDLHGALLVFAATNQREVNAAVAQEAAGLGVLCNVADAPEEGNFHVPALHRQVGLTIAVGSGGQSPTQTKQMRDKIAEMLSQEGSGLASQPESGIINPEI